MLFAYFALLYLPAVAIIITLATTWIRRDMKLQNNGSLPLLSVLSRTGY
jgi:hypothetical protein